MIIQAIQSGILFLGIDAKWSIFVTGAVIILAVAVDQLVRRQRERRARDVVDAVKPWIRPTPAQRRRQPKRC